MPDDVKCFDATIFARFFLKTLRESPESNDADDDATSVTNSGPFDIQFSDSVCVRQLGHARIAPATSGCARLRPFLEGRLFTWATQSQTRDWNFDRAARVSHSGARRGGRRRRRASSGGGDGASLSVALFLFV